MLELSLSDWLGVLGVLGTVIGIVLTLYFGRGGQSSPPGDWGGDVGYYADYQLAEPRTFAGWCDRYIWWRHRPLYVHVVTTLMVILIAACGTVYLSTETIDDGPFRAVTALLHQISAMLMYPLWGVCAFFGLRLLRQLFRA